MAKIIGECHFIGCIMQEKCAFEWDLQSGREDKYWGENTYNTESYVLEDKTFLGHLAHLWD